MKAPALAVCLAAWSTFGAEPEIPPSLSAARRLSGELRYEEAAVEYQRYLGQPGRPSSERAVALLELGFLHFLLNDSSSGERRAMEAFELDAELRLPSGASPKERAFLDEMRQRFRSMVRLELE